MTDKRLRIALLNDYEVVVHGLRAMLEPYNDRIEIVEMGPRAQVDQPVDVTLYDTFTQSHVDDGDIQALINARGTGAFVIYTWTMHPDLVAQAIAKGCRGYLDKSLSAAQLVESLESIANGEVVISEPNADHEGHILTTPEDMAWPGANFGLTAREPEVLALITRGLTNQDIASRSYLSINSVKSYIRSAYRKIGVERRSQAVRWGLENGMLPDFSHVTLQQ
ncbi:response regulator transcription factor [Tessaracoccus lubricantis]|uniref:Response regulator transcription factor n=1 Tax=Tessaracoccus lubricantis TaxID=545543 RepID=A0ABP9FHE3_9ACTN